MPVSFCSKNINWSSPELKLHSTIIFISCQSMKMKLISIVAIVCHCSKHFAEKLVLHFAYNKMTWMEFTIQLCEIHTTELQCVYNGYIVIHSRSMFWSVDSHGRNYRHINVKSSTNKNIYKYWNDGKMHAIAWHQKSFWNA